MVPGDWLDYRFEAQRPVAFNIHYHEGQGGCHAGLGATARPMNPARSGRWFPRTIA